MILTVVNLSNGLPVKPLRASLGTLEVQNRPIQTETAVLLNVIALEADAPAVYPLTSTSRLNLLSADFTFGQSQSQRLPTSTWLIGGVE